MRQLLLVCLIIATPLIATAQTKCPEEPTQFISVYVINTQEKPQVVTVKLKITGQGRKKPANKEVGEKLAAVGIKTLPTPKSAFLVIELPRRMSETEVWNALGAPIKVLYPCADLGYTYPKPGHSGFH